MSSPAARSLIIVVHKVISTEHQVMVADGWTPLYWTAQHNFLDVARLLIEHGANTDGIDLSWMDDQEDGSCAE